MNLARSTYYYAPKAREEKTAKELLERIEALALEFPGYGYRRVTKALHREGRRINHKVVLVVMREHGLLCKQKRRFVKTTDSNHPYPVYPDLAGHLVVLGPNELWVADITYIRLGNGFVYLAVILDAFSRKAVGYALSEIIDRQLTLAALRTAISKRQPPPGCVHHSDRGVQYAAHEYVDCLREHGFQISMSRKGNPYDNAMAESFMKTLKYEAVYLTEYETIDEAWADISEFIDAVYNQKRLHSSLGYMPPNEFEADYQKGGDPAGAGLLCSVA